MPERSREDLEREITSAKANLADHVSALRARLEEKVDVRARARVAAARARQRARLGLADARGELRAHAALYTLIAASAVALIAGVLLLRRARRA